jgi:MSHA biogenesis protein MshL
MKKHPVSALGGRRRPLAQMYLLVILLTGCQSSSKHTTLNTDVLADVQQTMADSAVSAQAVDQSDALPRGLLEALVPGLSLDAAAMQPVEERFDFAVRQPLDVQEFFSLLFEGTEYSVIVHPDVTGTISALDLKNVSIPEAMAQVSAIYGLSVYREGTIYRVEPGGLQTRIFKVDYLDVQRNGTSNMSVTGGNTLTNGVAAGGMNGVAGIAGIGGIGAANGSIGSLGGLNGGLGGGLNGGQGGQAGGNTGGASVNTRSESDYWSDLEEVITSIIGSAQVSGGMLDTLGANAGGNDRAVIISPQTGMIVVRAYPSELDKVAEFLSMSQSILQRQVVLEAKILEVTLNESFQSGINLALLDRINGDDQFAMNSSLLGLDSEPGGNGTAVVDPLAPITQSLQVGFNSRDFDAVIRLLETQGNVQVISSPRITTLNNQKAVFKVGDEEYFATNPTTGVTTGTAATTTNQNANLQPFFSGISLDVTPQISDEGDIILHIHPLLNLVQQDSKTIGNETFPLAKSDTRESDSIARARNGEVIVISGLMQTRAKGSEAGVPGVRKMAVVGNVFEQRSTELEKTELVILLRAIVDEGNNMQDLLKEHEDGFQALRNRTDPYYRDASPR